MTSIIILDAAMRPVCAKSASRHLNTTPQSVYKRLWRMKKRNPRKKITTILELKSYTEKYTWSEYKS